MENADDNAKNTNCLLKEYMLTSIYVFRCKKLHVSSQNNGLIITVNASLYDSSEWIESQTHPDIAHLKCS